MPTRVGTVNVKDARAVVRLFLAQPSVLQQIRGFLRQQATKARLSAEVTEDLVVAVSEACGNCVRHTVTPDIKVTWRANRLRVEVRIEDRGVFRDSVPVPDVRGDGGYGIILMTALTDEISIHQGTLDRPGTVVHLVKYSPDHGTGRAGPSPIPPQRHDDLSGRSG